MYKILYREAEEAQPYVNTHRWRWAKATMSLLAVLTVLWFCYPLAFWIGVLFIVAAVVMIVKAG